MCVYLFRDVDPVNLGSFVRAYISLFRVTGDGRACVRASSGCLRRRACAGQEPANGQQTKGGGCR